MDSHPIARSHSLPDPAALAITRDTVTPGVRTAASEPRARSTGNAPGPARPASLPWFSRRGRPRANPVAQLEALFAEAGQPRQPSLPYFSAPTGSGALRPADAPSGPPDASPSRQALRPGSLRIPDLSQPVKAGARMGRAELRARATQIHIAVREHFRGHGKSANKCRVPTHPDDVRATRDLARWLHAFEQLASMQLSQVPRVQQINARVGNCDEMAFHAALLARESGLSAQLWGLRDSATGMGLHTICLVAPPGAKDRPGGEWVIDPWAGIVDRAANYGVRMQQKMEKWAEEGKHIYCFRRQVWMKATDPRWLDAVLNARAVRINA